MNRGHHLWIFIGRVCGVYYTWGVIKPLLSLIPEMLGAPGWGEVCDNNSHVTSFPFRKRAYPWGAGPHILPYNPTRRGAEGGMLSCCPQTLLGSPYDWCYATNDRKILHNDCMVVVHYNDDCGVVVVFLFHHPTTKQVVHQTQTRTHNWSTSKTRSSLLSCNWSHRNWSYFGKSLYWRSHRLQLSNWYHRSDLILFILSSDWSAHPIDLIQLISSYQSACPIDLIQCINLLIQLISSDASICSSEDWSHPMHQSDNTRNDVIVL